MKKTKIFYWIFTSLFGLMMLGSAIPDVFLLPEAAKGMHEDLGYPLYFIPFIGVAKVLGAAVILIPGFPGIKEWAYAGLIFDLIGATYSILASGQTNSAVGFMLIPLLLGTASYIFYHRKIKASMANSTTQTKPSLKNDKVRANVLDTLTAQV